MPINVSTIVIVFFLLLFGASVGFAQSSGLDYPDPIRENLAKRRIKEEEKEYEQTVKRGEEAAKLSEELSKSYEENQKLSETDKKKLEKLEKLVSRIRRDLGAEGDEDEKDERPPSTSGMLEAIKEKTAKLVAELKKASRYSVSVVAVESSNAVVRMVRFLRFEKNKQ